MATRDLTSYQENSTELSKFLNGLRKNVDIHCASRQAICDIQYLNFCNLRNSLTEQQHEWAFGTKDPVWLDKFHKVVPTHSPEELLQLQKKHPPFGLFQKGPILVENSGSTTEKRRLPFNLSQWIQYVSPAARGLAHYGIDHTDVILTTDVGSTQAGYRTIEEAATWYCSSTVINERSASLPRKLTTMEEYGVTVFVGNGPKIERIMKMLSHTNLANQLKLIIITGIPTTRTKQIEDTFGCPVTDYYGSSEMGHTYYKCKHNQRHVHVDFVSVIQKQNKSLFSNIATLPIFNYDLGDELHYEWNGRCDCGSFLPVVTHFKTKDFSHINKE